MTDKPGRAKLFPWHYLIYDFVKVTASLPGIVWYRPKIVYENKKAKKKIRGGAILISNHIGFFDPVPLQFVVWYRRHHFIVGRELTEAKNGWILKKFLCIPIDRNNTGIGTIREITAKLKAGEMITMFPEGHIGDSNGVAAFKSGMVLMAVQSKRPIVPVYIQEKKRFWNRLRAAVGEPIDVCAMFGARPTFKEIEQAAELLHKKEEELERLIQQTRRDKK